MPSLSYLAIVLGGILIFTRLPGVFYPKAFGKFLKTIMKEGHYIRVFAVLPFILSISILLNKYDFTKDWETVMSVIGWLLLLASLYLAWCTECVREWVNKFVKWGEGWMAFFCLVGVAVGVGLIYLGFYVY